MSFDRCRVCGEVIRRECLGLLNNGTSTELLCRFCMAWALELPAKRPAWVWAVFAPSWCEVIGRC